jgi:hypothetical protein
VPEFVEEPAEQRLQQSQPERQGTGAEHDVAPLVSARTARPAMTPASILSLQRAAGNAATVQTLVEEPEQEKPSPVHDTIGSGGDRLDAGTRSQMERHFGEDFSSVRVHTDSNSAESVGAAAYTVGNDIVMNPSHFEEGTPQAQRMLAHELTHVVQQRSGPVDGASAPGGIRVSDPHDQYEQAAEHKADTVMRAAKDEEVQAV